MLEYHDAFCRPLNCIRGLDSKDLVCLSLLHRLTAKATIPNLLAAYGTSAQSFRVACLTWPSDGLRRCCGQTAHAKQWSSRSRCSYAHQPDVIFRRFLGGRGGTMILRGAIVFLSLLLLLCSATRAEKRVALVIGNGVYAKVPKLDNPKNDAAAMEAMLKAAGFDMVVRANDLGAAAMRRALRDFSDTAYDADIAVVFYAGHGMEVSGINYLIPTDAVLERDIDIQDEAISLDRVNQILEPVKRLRFIILDACRDNPFVRSMRRTLATRTLRSGYGEIDEKSLPPNTLVAYAQRVGATAEDGAGANSPYTTALLKHLPTPGLDVELALRRARVTM